MTTPILFLHGWGGNADSFAPISNYFARTQQVLTPTLPCPPDTVYNLADYARDVLKYLHDHGVTQCAVVAHSFGARLVAVLNAMQPTLFTKIVITGGAGLPPRRTLTRWWRLRKNRKQGGSPDYRNLSPNGKKTFQNIVNRDLTPEIGQITAPTLIINGDRDDATPCSMAKRWHRLVRGSQLKVYRGCGHFAYLDRAAQFIQDVRQWLN